MVTEPNNDETLLHPFAVKSKNTPLSAAGFENDFNDIIKSFCVRLPPRLCLLDYIKHCVVRSLSLWSGSIPRLPNALHFPVNITLISPGSHSFFVIIDRVGLIPGRNVT